MATWKLDMEEDFDDLDGRPRGIENGTLNANVWVLFPNSSNISSGKNSTMSQLFNVYRAIMRILAFQLIINTIKIHITNKQAI